MSEAVPQPTPTEPTEPQPTEPQPTEPTPEPTPGEGAPTEPAPSEGEPAPDEPAQPEPETEPPQPQGLTPEEYEARWTKAEKSFATYTRRVTELWEEDATKLVPLTFSPSAPPGFLSADDRGRIPEDAKKSLLDFLGIVQETEYELDPSQIACSLCHGLGKTKTESQVPEYRVLICRVCKGTGLAPAVHETANGPAPLAEVPAVVGGESEYQQARDADDWGHPRLLPDGMPNPNYGKMPQYVDPQFP